MLRRSYASCASTGNCDGSTGSKSPLYRFLLRLNRFSRIALSLPCMTAICNRATTCLHLSAPDLPNDKLVVDKGGPDIMVQGRWPTQPLD